MSAGRGTRSGPGHRGETSGLPGRPYPGRREGGGRGGGGGGGGHQGLSERGGLQGFGESGGLQGL
ncbi:unnamed protein product, partial [Lampetra fluviatilis]